MTQFLARTSSSAHPPSLAGAGLRSVSVLRPSHSLTLAGAGQFRSVSVNPFILPSLFPLPGAGHLGPFLSSFPPTPFTLAGAGHFGPSLSTHFTTPSSLAGAGHLGPFLSLHHPSFPYPDRSRLFRSVPVTHPAFPNRCRPFRSVPVFAPSIPFFPGRSRPFKSVSVLPSLTSFP